MLSLGLLFTVALVAINEIYGEVTLNLDDVLNALENQQKQNQELQSSSSSSSETSDVSASDNENGILQGAKLVRFFQQARDKDNKRKLTENTRLSDLYTYLTKLNDGRSKYIAKNKDVGGDYVDYDTYRNSKVDDFVEYLLSQRNKNLYSKDKSKLNIRDDYLLALNNKKQPKSDKLSQLPDRDDNNEGLQDYSRIYVILNPDALKSSQNRKDLSELVSQLMSKSSSVSQSRITPKQLHYKGFPVKGAYVQRRSRRDSFEGGNSMDDRPKRPKYNNHYGGGGRTPIPYIKHRGGDIYEREN